jgi:hypothetical protein
MIKRSSKKDILISKIVIAIFSLYSLYWIINNLSNVIFYFMKIIVNYYDSNSIFYFMVFLATLIFQINLMFLMHKDKEPKYLFTNFERNLHPLFYDQNQKKLPFFFQGALFLFIIFFLFIIINNLNFNDIVGSLDELRLYIFIYLSIFLHLYIYFIIRLRKGYLEKFPTKLLKKNKIRMVVVYEDYINQKIVDNEPHLTSGQFFKVVKKEYSRNSEEEITIEIRNTESPEYPALVTKINDISLSEKINERYELKVRVVEMMSFAKVEIELWLEDIENEFVKLLSGGLTEEEKNLKFQKYIDSIEKNE